MTKFSIVSPTFSLLWIKHSPPLKYKLFILTFIKWMKKDLNYNRNNQPINRTTRHSLLRTLWKRICFRNPQWQGLAGILLYRWIGAPFNTIAVSCEPVTINECARLCMWSFLKNIGNSKAVAFEKIYLWDSVFIISSTLRSASYYI